MQPANFDFPDGHINRRGRLITSGIIFGLMGCLLCLNVVATGFSMAMVGFSSGSVPPAQAAEMEGVQKMMRISAIINFVIYGTVTSVFISVAFGSIFLKRWSRPLALIFAWLCLYMGVVGVLSMLWMGPMMQEAMTESVAATTSTAPGSPSPPPAMPDNFFGIFIAIMVIFAFVFGILLPGLLIWLNWHQDVRVTLEFADPKPRWTDRCPVPVLGISVTAGLGAITTLASLALPWAPFFGKMLTGSPARLFFGVVILLLAFIAWATYRRMLAGWIAAIILVVGGVISSWLSMPVMDLRELYTQMGMPQEQIDLMFAEGSPFGKMFESGSSMTLMMVAGFLPIIAYLVWAFRFFQSKNLAGEGNTPESV